MNQASIKFFIACLGLSILWVGTVPSVFAQKNGTAKELDATVEKFLNENRRSWHDLNVPYKDGKHYSI